MARFTKNLGLVLESIREDMAANEEQAAAEEAATEIDVSVSEDGQATVEVTTTDTETGDETTVAVTTPDPEAAEGEQGSETTVQTTTETAEGETTSTTEEVAAADAASGETTSTETEDAAAGNSNDVADEGAAGEDVVTVPPVVSADEVVVDNSDSLEEAIADVSEVEKTVDETEDKIDALEEAAAGLESIRSMFDHYAQVGGLSRQGAEMARVAVEAYCAPIGLTDSPMVAMEQFDGDTRLKATTYSAEALADRLKAIWAAIMKTLTELKDRLWNYVKSQVSAIERLRARAEKLAKVKLSGTPGAPTIELKGYAKRIAVGTKVEVDPARGMANLIQVVNGAKAMDEQQRKNVDQLKAMADRAANGTLKAEELEGVSLTVSAGSGFTNEDGNVTTKVLPGNVRFQIHTTATNGVEYPRVVVVKDDVKISDEAKIPTMTIGQIMKTGTAVMELHRVINDLNAAAARSSKELRNQKPAVPSANLSGEDASLANKVLGLYRTVSSNQGQLSARVAAHAIQVASVYIRIAEKSAAQYKGGSAQLMLSKESIDEDTFITEYNLSTESLSARTRAIMKSFFFGADGTNMHMGHKAESLAKKIAKLEMEIEEAKALKASKIVSSRESEEVSMEGIKGGFSGYKEGAKAFWTKDGKLSWPSFKRYHDWLEKMQKDIDAKSEKVKELKAELKALAKENKAK